MTAWNGGVCDENQHTVFGAGFRYQEKDGDNIHYAEKPDTHFFYYEAHFQHPDNIGIRTLKNQPYAKAPSHACRQKAKNASVLQMQNRRALICSLLTTKIKRSLLSNCRTGWSFTRFPFVPFRQQAPSKDTYLSG